MRMQSRLHVCIPEGKRYSAVKEVIMDLLSELEI